MSNSQPQALRQVAGRLSRYAWVPIPLLVTIMAVLWIVDSRVVWSPPALNHLVHYGAAALGVAVVMIVAGRSFLAYGQPSVLMLGSGVLMLAIGTVAQPTGIMGDTGTGSAVYNTSALLAALCHFIAIAIVSRRRIRLEYTTAWLIASSTGSLVAMGLVIGVALTGRMPIFFIDGQGGTLSSSLVVSGAMVLFFLTAALLWQTNRRIASSFLHWYALGLVLVAAGLAGSLVITVRDSPLQWLTLCTQVLGLLYMCGAVLTLARRNGIRECPLAAVEEAWRKHLLFAGIRLQAPLQRAWRFGLAVVAVITALALWMALEAWVGPGLPTYVTFYPAVMAVAILTGFAPGMVVTVLTSLAVAFWILPPVGQLAIAAPVDRLGMVIFTTMGLGMSALAALYQRHRRKAAAYDREMALRDTKARLATFAEASFEGIVESEAGRIIDCNEQFARMSGYAVTELRGMDFADLIAPEDLDRVMANAQYRESVIEHAMFRKDGTPLVVEAHGRCVFPNSTTRYTAIRDITERKQMEQALLRAKNDWESTFDSMPDPIAILDEHHRFRRINRAMAKRLGHAPKDCVGLACHSCVHDLDVPPAICPHSQTLKDGKEHTAEMHEDRLGGDFLVTTTPLHDVNGQMMGSVHVARDITERKQKEEQLLLLNRTLKARTRSSEAMIRATEETAYLGEVCKSLVEDCGHAMVWIGYAENDAGKTVRPVASAGFEAGYLEKLEITWADTERGRGPTGTAIRTGQVTTCRNMLIDPNFAPWREEATKRGYTSSVVLPLMAGERCFGTLSIYNRQPDPFTEHETGLLMEMADKLAFGIIALRQRIEHARMEEVLRKNQALLVSTQRSAQIGGWDYDGTTDRVTWTDEMYRIYGVSPETFDPSDFTKTKEFFALNDWERLEMAFRRAVTQGIAFDLKLGCTAADGRRLWVRTMGQAERQREQVVRVFGNTMDITELYQAHADIEKANRGLEARVVARTALLTQTNEELFREVQSRQRTEEALREGEARWRSYVENAPYGIFIGDDKGKFLQINPETCRISGYNETELLAMGIPDLLTPDSLARGRADFADFKKNGRITREYQCRSKNGELRWWSAAIVLLPDNCFLGFINDVTERRRMRSELQASEERYRTLVDTTPDLIYSLDREGRNMACNRSFCRALGRPEYQIVGRTHADLGFPDDIVCRFNELRRQALNGESIQTEMVVPLPETDPRTYDIVLYPIISPEGEITGVRGICRDVTDQRKVEAQLLQSQKMEAVGHLAGGVAHDFNNMLTVINGNAEMALLELDAHHSIAPLLSGIMEASYRSADLTRQLLAFARKQTVVPKVMDLNKTVQGMLKMLRRLIGENITIAWNPGTDLWSVKLDPSQVDQILANLAVNARDAVSGAGSFIIETENVTLDEAYCTVHTDAIPGPFVMLAVSDSGCGMDQEVAKHIFEPFFTTKAPGKGTGLGLATVYGIVQQNHGFIHVYSEPGVGTTFKIYLPRYAGSIEKETVAKTEALPKGHAETVLVVEDESLVRDLVRGMLATLGYRVLLAGTPTEARALTETHHGEIHLLLTDVVMPEMDGRELSDQLLARRPEMRCLFMSGYSAEVISHHGILKEGVHFIPKPLKLKELALAIRAVLDQK